MANQPKVETFQIGETVYNTEFENFEKLGKIVDKGGKLKVQFTYNANGKDKTVNVEVTDKWQKIPSDAPENILQKILDNAAQNAGNGAGASAKDADAGETGDESAPKDETASSSAKEPETTFEPLSDDEKTERKKLIAEYKSKETVRENAYLRQCEIIHIIREKTLFRDSYRTFAEFAVAELQIAREYAQNLAQIGAFYAVAKDYIGETKLSVKSINQLIRNQNKLARDFDLQALELSDFAPVIEKVLDATIEASKDGKGKATITPRVVDAVSDRVSETLQEIKGTKKTGADLIALAAEKLGAKRADILTQAKESLQETGKKKSESGGSGAKSQSSGEASQVYAGALSNLVVSCTLHTEFAGNKITNIGNGTVQTKCGCKFKMVGFDLVPIEIEGKRVKQQS